MSDQTAVDAPRPGVRGVALDRWVVCLDGEATVENVLALLAGSDSVMSVVALNRDSAGIVDRLIARVAARDLRVEDLRTMQAAPDSRVRIVSFGTAVAADSVEAVHNLLNELLAKWTGR